jgi:hypothetical protein
MRTQFDHPSGIVRTIFTREAQNVERIASWQ